MPKFDINLDGDNAWPDLRAKQNKIIHVTDGLAVCALDGGMASGKPSVCFRIDLPDGRVVLAETSARLFVMAAAAIVGKWPDVDDGTMLAHIERGRQTASVEILRDQKADYDLFWQTSGPQKYLNIPSSVPDRWKCELTRWSTNQTVIGWGPTEEAAKATAQRKLDETKAFSS